MICVSKRVNKPEDFMKLERLKNVREYDLYSVHRVTAWRKPEPKVAEIRLSSNCTVTLIRGKRAFEKLAVPC